MWRREMLVYAARVEERGTIFHNFVEERFAGGDRESVLHICHS
jgi:hypothetical protein